MPNNMLYLGINLLMLDMPRYRLYWRGGRTENSRLIRERKIKSRYFSGLTF